MAKDPYRYFRIEAGELIEELGRGILEVEREGLTEALSARLVRCTHTLKGAARVVKLPHLAEIAHQLEGLVLSLHEDRTTPTADDVRTLLGHVDALANGLAALGPSALAAPLAAPVDAASPPPVPAPAPPAPTKAAAPAPATETAASFASSSSDPLLWPAPAPAAPVVSKAIALPVTPAARSAAEHAPVDVAAHGVRVQLPDLDRLLEGLAEASMAVAGINRELATVERVRSDARALVAGLRMDGRRDERVLLELAERTAHGLDELRRTLATRVDRAQAEIAPVRESAEELRLLPASGLTASLERSVRDAAEFSQKRVVFELTGGDTRLDAHVLSSLAGALLHLVRNSVAHGIEAPELRELRGKPATGRVELRVSRTGGRVRFRCSDDGAGIDVESVRNVAIARGIVSDEVGDRLTADELLQLCFHTGMSTARGVTELAGRGVGLDAVRDTVARLKGEIVLTSSPGQGAAFEVTVPVSLASVPALVVEAAGTTASMPIDCIRGTLRVHDAEIARAAVHESIIYEGQAIPFLPLAVALKSATSLAGRGRSWSAVIVESGSRRAAVGVDRLLGASTVVVRPLPAEARIEAVVAGASVDAEGNPRPVLDARGVVELAHSLGRPIAPAEENTRPPVLVIDDSMTTRLLEQAILESAGYAVDTATSAEEALGKARERHYGVFVVDVEMPGMSGFDFVAHTRGDPSLRETPAILVTSRGAPEDRRRGLQAGARAYIVKDEFSQEVLLQRVRELIG
jgi:two-component system chemotaxis sensor kinase CheA